MSKKLLPRAGSLLSLILVLSLMAPSQAAQAASAGVLGQKQGLHLAKSDETGVVVVLTTAQPRFTPAEIEGSRYDVLELGGLESASQEGKPQVPVQAVMLGIPLSATPHISVLRSNCSVLKGVYRLPPGPQPLRTRNINVASPDDLIGPKSQASEAALTYEKEPAVYKTDAYYPAEQAVITSTGFLRNQRYAEIELYPAQYNSVTGKIRLCRELTVEVQFRYPTDARLARLGTTESAGAFEPILAEALLNYDSARHWRGDEAQLTKSAIPTEQDASFKIMVQEDGIYRVTATELRAAGAPVDSIDPQTLKLSYRGSEVPIRVVENGGLLDYFLFYGQAAHSKYTNTNVYWLGYGGTAGLRMAGRNAAPSPSVPIAPYCTRTAHLEQDKMYFSEIPWRAGADHWYWGYTWYPTPQPSLVMTQNLYNLSTEPYSATLRANLHGYINLPGQPDHCIQIYLNDHQLLYSPLLWDGVVEQNPSVSFPSTYLTLGTNRIRMQGCASAAPYDIILHNWAEIDYRDLFIATADGYDFSVDAEGWQYDIDGFSGNDVQVFDITNANSVGYLDGVAIDPSGNGYAARFYDSTAQQGSRYLALRTGRFKAAAGIARYFPANLTDGANHADYIVIAHPTLLAGLSDLASHRAAQGLTTRIVSLEDVYDEFNFGVLDPEAIHSFLDYAYHNWTAPAPTYVLLVGDGTYDFLNNTGTGAPNLVPPYLAFVDPWIGEAAADNRYVTVAGDDRLPDMLLGRLPAENLSQLANMVSKIMAYEGAGTPADWEQRLFFVTDNPDSAGNFYRVSDAVIDGSVPAPYIADKAYLGQTCPYQNPAVACRKKIVDTFNITGTLLVNYIGHGGNQLWASEQMMNVNSLSSLVPTTTFPIMLPMTCSEGDFDYPGVPCLGESIVRAAGKGAVASWSPTGLGIVTGHDALNRGFLDAVFKDGIRTLGQATMAGDLRLWATHHNLELLDTYVLFGDPALHINALDTDLRLAKAVESTGQLTPGDSVTYTLTFTNAGPAMAFGTRLTDALPVELVNPVVVDASPEVLAPVPGITYAWTISDLLPGESGWVQVRAEVGPLTQSHTVANRAEISNNIPDTDEASNAAEAQTYLYLPKADLAVTKTVEPAGQLVPGDVATYTLSFSNAGPDVAQDVLLTDLIPPEFIDLEVVYASPVVISTTPGMAFAWQIADLAAGGSGLIQVRAVVGPLAQSHMVTNQAVLASSTFDPNPLDNLDAVSSYLYLPNADLQVVKTTQPEGQRRPGDVLTYTLSFANAGPDPAYGVVLTDVIPGALVSPTIVFSSPEVISRTPGITYAWHLADLTAGQGGLVQVRGVVSPTAQHGFVMLNGAHIAGRTADLTAANNTSLKVTGVNVPDMAVVKSGPLAATFSQTITYTLAWGNVGPVPADGVYITDTLPPWVRYVADNSGWPHTEPAPGVIVWQVQPDLAPPGGMQTFVVTGWVTMDIGMNGPLVNQVQISNRLPDGDPSNNTGQWSTALLLPDLAVRKTGPASAIAQSDISYTLSYSNAGLVGAGGVLITDVLPLGLTYLSDDSGFPHGEPQPGVHVWQVQPDLLTSGAAGSFAVHVQVADYTQLGAGLRNSVAIGAGLPEADPTNNAGEWTTIVLRPDLAIGLAGPAQAVTASLITYTLAYSNVGSGPAAGAALTDVLPAGVTYVGDDSGLPHAEPQPGVHVWQVAPGLLPARSSRTFRLRVRLGTPGQTGAAVVNHVQIGTGPAADLVPGNNGAEWSTGVIWPELAVGLAGPAETEPMTTITYTVSYTNSGVAPAESVLVTDVLPLGVSYVSDDSGLVHSQPQPGVYVWQVAPQPFLAGSSGSFHLVVHLGRPGQTGTLLLNHAEIGAITPDAITANDTALWWTFIPRHYLYLPLVTKAYRP